MEGMNTTVELGWIKMEAPRKLEIKENLPLQGSFMSHFGFTTVVYDEKKT